MGSVSIALPFDDRWFFAEALRGARSRIEEAGHRAVVHVIPPSPTSTMEAVQAIDADFTDPDSLGAIALGFRYRPEQRERTLAFERPLVVIGGSVLGFPSIAVDHVGAAWSATDLLMRLGHTRITHFAGELDGHLDFSVFGRRARGFRLAMERAGYDPVIVETDLDPARVRATAREVLSQRDRPTAVFAASDDVALAVMEAARELGIEIGDGLSVVGFDDQPEAAPAGLTTVRQRPEEQGAAAADLLLSGVGRGPDPKQSRLMPTALIERDSTRRLRRG